MFVNNEMFNNEKSFGVFVEEVDKMNEYIKRINENNEEMEFYKRQIDDIKENCKNTVSVHVDNIGSEIEVYIDVLIDSLEEKIERLKNYVDEYKKELFVIYGKIWINYFPGEELILAEKELGVFHETNRCEVSLTKKVEKLYHEFHEIK